MTGRNTAVEEVQLSRQTLQQAPRIVVLSIVGEGDYHNGRRIETYFDEMLEADKPRHVLLDLSGLTFAASVFFGSLLFWRESMTARNGFLVLYGLRPEVASTLRIVALDRVLKICPDQQAALAALPK